MPALVRPFVRGARVVLAASAHLAAEAYALGARDVVIVPTPIDVPAHVGEPDDPPHVLFAGRLSAEKGILEFLEATDGLPRVVVGDGSLRDRVTEAVGFVPPSELGAYYERAAVVCVPSRREGYGMTAREAMAHGRPVVATRVGGLVDLGPGAVLVEPGNLVELRGVVERLLGDPAQRSELGRQGRENAVAPQAAAELLAAAYRHSLA